MIEKANIKDKKILKNRSHFLLLTSYFSLKKGQVMLEFVFCMIVLFLMMYAIVMIFRWVGLDLGQRQRAHEELLTSPIDPYYGTCVTFNIVTMNCTDLRPIERGPLTQIDPYFYTPESMNAVWAGN